MLQQNYKALYDDIKPDCLLIEATKERMKETARDPRQEKKIVAICATIAAAVIVTVAAVLWASLLKPNPILLAQSGAESNGSFSASSENDLPQIDDEIPDWYQPGEFTVVALKNSSDVKVEGMSASAAGLPLIRPLGTNNSKLNSVTVEVPEGLVATGKSCGNYIGLYSKDTGSPYYTKDNIYYDLLEKEVICLDGADEAIAEQSGLITSDFVYTGSLANPVYDISILSFQNRKNGHTAYYVRYPDDRLEKLPVKDDELIDFRLSPDLRYAMILIDGNAGQNIDIWVVDLAQEEIVPQNITLLDGKKYTPCEFDVSFSENGKYITYLLMENGVVSRGTDSKWIMYGLESGRWVQGNGDIVRFVDDGRGVLTVTADGAKVLDTATGRDITAETELQEWEKTQALVLGYNLEYDRRYNIYSKSVFTPDEKATRLMEDAGRYFIRERYIYALFPDQRVITCYSLENGESFTIGIPDDFFETIKKEHPANAPVKYEIALSMDGTQLVVYYTIGGYYYPLSTTYAELLPQKFWMADSLADMQGWIKEIDAAASSELNSDTSQFATGSFSDSSAVISYTAPSDIWDAASDVSDIVSAPDYYYHFGGIEEPVTAYYGEGFTCIRFAFGDYLFTAVEDYRDHTFTLYYGDGFSNLNGVSIYQSVEYPAIDSFRKTLASGASQAKTRALFGFLPSDTAPFDYAELYTNGELDVDKVINRQLDQVFSSVVSAYVGRTNSGMNDEGHNAAEWDTLLEFLRQQRFEEYDTYSNTHGYWDCNGFRVGLKSSYLPYHHSGSVLFYIGRQQNTNKPFIYVSDFGRYLSAFPTEAEYQKIEAYLASIADGAQP